MTKASSAPLRMTVPMITVVAMLGGCGTTPATPDAAPTLDFRADAERVFRLQNRVMQDLIVENEIGEAQDQALAGVEHSLATNCRYLNESAALHASGEEPPLALKLSVLDSMDDCESAAREAERRLHGE